MTASARPLDAPRMLPGTADAPGGAYGGTHVSMFGDENRVELVLYTDALVTRGLVRTRQHRVTDILNHADEPFLILEDVIVEELGHRGQPIRADYAQVNLDAVLFAVANADGRVDRRSCGRRRRRPRRSSRCRRSGSSGTIHLLPTESDLREALVELTGRFLPVTDATYWSDRLGEARQTGAPGRGEPPAGADPGPAPGGRPVGGARPAPGQPRPRRPRRSTPTTTRQPDDRIR